MNFVKNKKFQHFLYSKCISSTKHLCFQFPIISYFYNWEDDNFDDVELLPEGVIRKQPRTKDSSIKAKYLGAFIAAVLIIGSLWHILFSFSSPPVHENYFVGVQTCEGKSWKLDSSGSWHSSQYVHIPCTKISGEPSDMRNNGPIVRVDS